MAGACGDANALPKVAPPHAIPPPSPYELDYKVLSNDPRCLPDTGDDVAHRPYGAPLSLVDAELILICTTRFEIGMMPPKRQAHAFNVLFDQPDALKRFEAVDAAAGPAGRLYALAAFDLLSPPDADRVAASLAVDGRQVAIQESDLVLEKPVSELMQLVRRRGLGREFRRDHDAIAAYYKRAR